MINDSGERRKFESGAVRDIQEGKGRCDLLPLIDVGKVLDEAGKLIPVGTTLDYVGLAIQEAKEDCDEVMECVVQAIVAFVNFRGWNPYEAMLELSKHFEEGALKYGDRNWEKGIPWHCYFDSGVRHYLKYKAGYTDERHDRAFLWNMICLMWTIRNHPELNDIYEGEKEC